MQRFTWILLQKYDVILAQAHSLDQLYQISAVKQTARAAI
jgi:hypothetical protein